jgi:hypothetical protein
MGIPLRLALPLVAINKSMPTNGRTQAKPVYKSGSDRRPRRANARQPISQAVTSAASSIAITPKIGATNFSIVATICSVEHLSGVCTHSLAAP